MRRYTQPHPMDYVDLVGKLADLKEEHYRTTLALTAIMELLTEKGLLTEQEIRSKAAALDVLVNLAPTPRGANPTW
ncbi:hypothetical protein [Gorillibacterium sp. sgz5001074]|uniref:hypothetical protein n=1 Tax=Gorillibacterium sp. sgz5001074 TaxID=3446695 RepID=UPI003F664761